MAMGRDCSVSQTQLLTCDCVLEREKEGLGPAVLSGDRKWKMTTGWKAAGPCETIWVCNLELITGGSCPPTEPGRLGTYLQMLSGTNNKFF